MPFCLTAFSLVGAGAEPSGSQPLELNLRQLRKLDAAVDKWESVTNHARWEPSRTAAVICDMWNRHWCKGATARVAEMAPRMNEVVTELRRRGVLIIHCPSDTMKYYEGTPGRKLAQGAPPVETAIPLKRWAALEPEREGALPIDDADGGCSDDPPCTPATQAPWPWEHQIDTLQIKEGDAITDSAEAFYLMRQRGITNVIVMGVHENMCVLGRPFSIRQMVSQGMKVALLRDLTDTMYNPRQKPYVDHFTGTDLVTWHIEKYWCPTITSDQIIGGAPFRFAADAGRPAPVFRNYVKLPATDSHYRQVRSYVEDTPNPGYSQAPESSRIAFRQMKYGVRIHWGVYAMLDYGCNASWPFVRADSGHPMLSHEGRQAYQQFYRRFNPTNFNADDWMDLFQTNGIKVVAFTTKHHDGFSMFDTHARVARRVNWTAAGGPKIEECDTAYSVMESPFGRDIVKEVTAAAHSHGMKIDLYFSHPDWYDADFRPFAFHPLTSRVNKTEHPDQWDHFVKRHRQQLTELLTQYGKIDLVCLDMWFDETAWLDLRETIKSIRQIQPDVMLRCRGIGNYGDYYTPEGFVPGAKENTDMPWMVIYPLAGEGIWSYEPDAGKYKDGSWIVTNLVDTVAKGGNFMVGIGPDATGLFHPKAIEALQSAGAWLKLNEEAIFNTHPLPGDGWKEGNNLRFTHSDRASIIYALALQWPGEELVLHSVKLPPGATVTMLGDGEALPWRPDAAKGTVISLPARWQSAANRPGQLPWVFKLSLK
ncbi:MAG TPA: alpha-L-fucosidase [Verrucomicrobiae bacterium]